MSNKKGMAKYGIIEGTFMIFTPAQQTTLILLALALGMTFLAALAARALHRWVERKAIRRAEREGGLPGAWRALRDEVERSNRTLSRSAFVRARQLFLAHYASGGLSPAGLTREWGGDEFLVVVDEHGRPVRPGSEMLELFRKTATVHPSFRRWFKEVLLEGGEWAGAPTLMAGRWLCHMVGLRHTTVLVFLDPPQADASAQEDARTLVQVRSPDKFEAPGRLDIACAGHVCGVDTPEAALEKELKEELDITLDKLEDLRLLGRYNSYQESGDGRITNNEHRVLFRARLQAAESGGGAALYGIRFNDGEVAGMQLITLEALRRMAADEPDRMAGGLRDSLVFFESA
jgi:isopentenyldiphosphate isomerase